MNLPAACAFWERRKVRRALVALGALIVLCVLANAVRRALCGSTEFRAFREIVQVGLVEGKDHYTHIAHVRAYGPPFVILWSPFGLFPLGRTPDPDNALTGTTAWQVAQLTLSAAAALLLMAAMTVWSARFIASACDRERRWRACLAAGVWFASGGLMFNSIVRCETDMIVVFLVAAAMALMLAEGRDWEGGFCLGVATAFKLTPGLFGVYLLCRRKWGALAGMAVGGVVCAVVLPVLTWGFEGAYERYHSWVTNVMLPLAKEGPEAFIDRPYRRTNQSLTAATVRYLSAYNAGRQSRPHYVNVAGLSVGTARKVATGLKLLVLAALLACWLGVSGSCSHELEGALFALAPPGMLLLSDVSVGGHLAILAVPVGVLAAFCLRRQGERAAAAASWGMPAALFVTYLIAVPTLKELSAGTLGVLAIFGLLLFTVRTLVREGRAIAPMHAD